MQLNPKTFKTLEFYIVVLGAIAPWLADAASSQIDPRTALIANILSAAVYTAARGLAKINSDVKDFWHTSEFYVTIIGSIAAGIGVLTETIGGEYWLQLQGLLLAVGSIVNGIRKDPMVATGAVPVVAIDGYADEEDLPDIDIGEGDDRMLGATEDPAKDS